MWGDIPLICYHLLAASFPLSLDQLSRVKLLDMWGLLAVELPVCSFHDRLHSACLTSVLAVAFHVYTARIADPLSLFFRVVMTTAFSSLTHSFFSR